MQSSSLSSFLIVILFLFSGSFAFCQDYPMLHYTLEDGLPSNTIYYVYRGSRGFLWIATDKGIARYNGIRFEKFTTFDGLADNEVFFFQEDNYGRLWIATYNGELCFYKDGIFHSAANTPFLKVPFKASFINEITLQKDSSVNIMFTNNLKFLNIYKEEHTIIDLKKVNNIDLVSSKLLYVEKESPNEYKITTTNKIYIIDTLYNIIDTFPVTRREYKDETPSLWRVAFDQNQYYIYNNKLLYNLDMQIIKKMPDNLETISGLYQIYKNDNGYFYTTNKGIILNDSIRILSDNKVTALTQDNQQNYWASTLDNGLFVFSKDFQNARIYKGAYNAKIKCTYADRKNVFFATSDHQISQIQNNKISKIFDYSKYLPQGVFSENSGFLIDSSYRFYNATNYSTVVVDNLASSVKKVKVYKNEFSHFSSVRNLYKAGDYLYVNARSKIMSIDYEKYKNTNELQHQDISDTSYSERIFGMAKAADNTIWYSTVNDIYKVENGQSISQPRLKNINLKYFDFYDNYLIGYTHKNQLIVCENYNDHMEIDTISEQNCIWDNLYRIDSNHVLISTNYLYRLITLDPGSAGKKFSIHAIENQFIPLKTEAVCSDGKRCYFFREGSITSIPVAYLFVKPDPPKLYYKFLKTGKKAQRIAQEMQIPFTEAKNISISFTTVSFAGKDIKYQYSVSKNEQDNWRDIGTEEINLLNSGYGVYEVRVRARSMSSDYCEPIAFTLDISQPFWTTWWFILLVSGMVLAIVGMVIRHRISVTMNKKDKEYSMELKFMKSEYKALNALMNPHFIFNTLNNVQGLVNRNDKIAANEYLRIFADLIRQNMYNISKEMIPLQKEIDLVANYLLLEKLRFKDLLNYSINIDENTDLTAIMVPPLLVQPLVENSIKHGILPLESAEGRIDIHIYERYNTVYIEVKDNGVGMNKENDKQGTLHESYGLENIKKRIEQLSVIQNKKIEFLIREIRDEAGKNQWTIVTISIPFSE